MIPFLETTKPITKRASEWFKVQALSSNPSTTTKKSQVMTVFSPIEHSCQCGMDSVAQVKKDRTFSYCSEHGFKQFVK
jgi:hypothetical protein